MRNFFDKFRSNTSNVGNTTIRFYKVPTKNVYYRNYGFSFDFTPIVYLVVFLIILYILYNYNIIPSYFVPKEYLILFFMLFLLAFVVDSGYIMYFLVLFIIFFILVRLL